MSRRGYVPLSCFNVFKRMKCTRVLKEFAGYPTTYMTGGTKISLELVVNAVFVVHFDIDTVHITVSGIE
jgi:hypothetical protein